MLAQSITTKDMKRSTILLILIGFSLSSFAQISGSAIRGQVVDKQSDFPLPGVTIILLNSEPLKGVTTDMDGYFRIEDVPAGRHA